MIDFTGRRVLITGAGGGVGAALCAAFAAAGAEVLGSDLPGAELPEVCAADFRFDLRAGEEVDHAAAEIVAAGAPHAVIQNAGWTRAETLADVTPETLVSEVDLNFSGPARLALALLPAMRDLPGDRAFVFISSVNAGAHFGNPAYSAAKAAALAWMRAIAVEQGQSGIRANAVVPASIRTHAWDHRIAADPGILDRVSRLYPLGRLVSPQEVAHAALFLASDLASGITGATLNVDAGLAAGNLPFLDAITSIGE